MSGEREGVGGQRSTGRGGRLRRRDDRKGQGCERTGRGAVAQCDSAKGCIVGEPWLRRWGGRVGILGFLSFQYILGWP